MNSPLVTIKQFKIWTMVSIAEKNKKLITMFSLGVSTSNESDVCV